MQCEIFSASGGGSETWTAITQLKRVALLAKAPRDVYPVRRNYDTELGAGRLFLNYRRSRTNNYTRDRYYRLHLLGISERASGLSCGPFSHPVAFGSVLPYYAENCIVGRSNGEPAGSRVFSFYIIPSWSLAWHVHFQRGESVWSPASSVERKNTQVRRELFYDVPTNRDSSRGISHDEVDSRPRVHTDGQRET